METILLMYLDMLEEQGLHMDQVRSDPPVAWESTCLTFNQFCFVRRGSNILGGNGTGNGDRNRDGDGCGVGEGPLDGDGHGNGDNGDNGDGFGCGFCNGINSGDGYFDSF